MNVRILILLICVATTGFFVVAATRIGIVWEKADLRWVAGQLNQQLTTEFTQTVQLAALLTQHEAVRAAYGTNVPHETVQNALDRLVLETSRLAILVADAKGNIIASGVRNPDFPNPFSNVWDTRALRPSPATLSRRFLARADGTWMFEIAKGITGPSREPLGFVIVYQAVQDQAQTWSALPERLSVSKLDGTLIYENRKPANLSWAPLDVTMVSRIHGTTLLIERSPRILLFYGGTGLILGFLLILALVFGASSVSRRQRLSEEKVGALAQDAANLEARVQDRTRALRDEIDQHKQTELALKESQSQLVQAAKFKVLNDMATGLAHEISQPLFALNATLDTLEHQLGTQSDPVRSSLGKAQRVTGRIGRILNNLKSFARKEQVEPVPVELSHVASSALEMLEHETARSQITLVHTPPLRPLFGMATPTRLQQVIVNLVSNSIDAAAKDGSGNVRIEYTENDAIPELHIRDNGPGFQDTETALTPFYTTKTDQNGLGLGLSISAEIMRVFGGALTLVETTKGGAHVVLRFKPVGAEEWP